jgi:hypothetical protein
MVGKTVPHFQFHQQDHAHYCAAACAQMVLTTLRKQAADKAKPGSAWEMEGLSQYDLQVGNYMGNIDTFYNYGQGKMGGAIGWQVDPAGLCYNLNENDPESSKLKFGYDQFRVFRSDSPDAISRMIVWSIWKYEVPAVALVMGTHWVVISGYTSDKQPDYWNDTSYKIETLTISDPRPRVRRLDNLGLQPPPHYEADNCGKGGRWGNKGHTVPYKTWLMDYFCLPVDNGHEGNISNPQYLEDSKDWIGRYIAVCACVDKDVNGLRDGGKPWQVNLDKETFYKGKMIDEITAASAPDPNPRGNPEDLLLDGPQWAVDLYNSGGVSVYDPDAHGKGVNNVPLKVERLYWDDQEIHKHYFIIPFVKGDDLVAAVRADNTSNNGKGDWLYRESMRLFPDESDGISLLLGNSGDFDGTVFTLKRGEGAIAPAKYVPSARYKKRDAPKLVWTPCIQSYSPFLTFYEYDVGGRGFSSRYRTNKRYVRGDGRPFKRLRSDIRGT